MKKRMFTLFLAFSLVLCLIPTAQAAESTTVITTSNREENGFEISCINREYYDRYTGEKLRSEETSSQLLRYVGDSDEVVVPATASDFYDGAGILWGERKASITSITLPDGIKWVRDWAFAGFPNLTRVVLPESIEIWGYCMFENCDQLTEVQVGDRVIPIGDGPVKDYSGFDLTKGGQVDANRREQTGDFIFGAANLNGLNPFYPMGWEENTLLQYQGDGGDVVIPEGITAIGRGAFAYRDDITSITIPEGVTYLDYYVFYGCENLESVTFPSTLKYTMGHYVKGAAHSENGQSLSGEIAQGLGSWGVSNFSGCYNLTILENIPYAPIRENLPDNLVMYQEWVNPGQYLTPQSQRITDQARAIVGEETDPYLQAKKISNWICENIEYDWNYYLGKKSTVVTDPEGVLDCRLTICDGYARLTAALCQAVGIPALYVTGPSYGVKGYENHAWNELYVDGRWLIVDNTFSSDSSYDYFDCGIVALSSDHKYATRPSASAEDIPSVWAQDFVKEAIAADIVPADLQGEYTTAATRGEFCALAVQLYETISGQTITGRVQFEDTKDENVEKAAALGVISGVGAGQAAPDGTLTREQAATMLARLAEACGKPLSSGDTAFADSAAISSWAEDSVNQVGANGIMSGTGNGNFSPKGQYTREQSITTMLRLFDYINK